MNFPKDKTEYIAGFKKNDKLGSIFDPRVISLEVNKCVLEYDPKPDHYNPNGILHGGALYTVMDSSQGLLVHWDLDPEFSVAATGTATIKYLAPVTSGTVRVRTSIVRKEGRKIFVDSEATAADGKPVAKLEEIWIAMKK